MIVIDPRTGTVGFSQNLLDTLKAKRSIDVIFLVYEHTILISSLLPYRCKTTLNISRIKRTFTDLNLTDFLCDNYGLNTEKRSIFPINTQPFDICGTPALMIDFTTTT